MNNVHEIIVSLAMVCFVSYDLGQKLLNFHCTPTLCLQKDRKVSTDRSIDINKRPDLIYLVL